MRSVIIVTSMRKQRNVRIGLLGLAAGLLIVSITPASASSANISHSYRSSQSIGNGSIVSLDPSKSDYVTASNTTNGQRILGVAVASDDSLLAVDSGAGTIQVATTGTASVLVSNLNGNIALGDSVAVSPFNGVGMKASSGDHIIGLAQSALAQSGSNVTTQTVKDAAGKNKQIVIGYVRINISPGTSSGSSTDASNNALQKLVRNITGKTIPTGRIIIALLILTVTLITLIVLIYGAISSTIIAIGRNPLAKYAVLRSLGTVLGMAIVIGVVSCILIFLLLR